MNSRIFIVEDDLVSAQYLKELLEAEGFEISGISDTAEAAITRLRDCGADLVLMDIILKGTMSGSEGAIQIKRRHPECKIIFLTAYADEEMIEYAVRSKAYAYLMKPYRDKEILATIRVALTHDTEAENREKVHEATRIPLAKGFYFDTEERKLYRHDKEIPLSEKKIKLIEILSKNRRHTVSNEQLCLTIWNEPRSNNTLRSLIHRFRQVVGEEIILNVNGIGYTILSE